MCVVILLYMCPDAAVCVSSYCCVCVLVLVSMCPHAAPEEVYVLSRLIKGSLVYALFFFKLAAHQLFLSR